MNCEECKHEGQNVVMSKYAYEREQAKDEYALKRAYRIILAVVIGWILTIGMFVGYLYQYDFIGYSYEQDGDGLNIAGGNNSGVYYGTESSYTQTSAEKP